MAVPSLVVLAACSGDRSPSGISSSANVASINLSAPFDTLRTGQSQQLHAVAKDSAGNTITAAFTWTSSNATVATVTNTGTINARASGTTSIVATVGNESASKLITVTPIPAVSLRLAAPAATLAVGATLQATATPLDSAGNALTGRSVTWSSSSRATATVSAAGAISGVAIGTVTITATSEGLSASKAFTVTAASTPPPPPVVAGIPAPGPGATIIQDLRGALQSATTIDQAFRIFGQVDHTSYRGARNTSGWSFTANADGNGLHALRADWEASTSTDQGIRVIDYLPSPKPSEMYIQWKARVGRYAFDTDGNGNADSYATFPQSNTCKRALVSQSSGLRIDYTLNRESPEIPKVEIDPRNFVVYSDPNVWSFNSEVGSAPYTSTIHIKAGSGANDGVYQLWIDDKLVLDVHNAPIDATTFDRWEFPATCTVVPQPQADYFWDFLIWRP